ncbi:MAG: hypothetical protein ACK5TO_19250, partial [Planctomycetaceae bacterium]
MDRIKGAAKNSQPPHGFRPRCASEQAEVIPLKSIPLSQRPHSFRDRSPHRLIGCFVCKKARLAQPRARL